MTGRSNSLISLLGGAAAGALAMYLLDPEQGRQRREHLAETAGEAVGTAGDSLGRAWENLSEQAKALSAAAAAKASAAGEYAHDAARRLLPKRHHAQCPRLRRRRGWASLVDRLSPVRSLPRPRTALRCSASDMSRSVSDSSSDAVDRARETSPPPGGRSAPGSAAKTKRAIFSPTPSARPRLSRGAGAMYFLDPDRGRGRRAWAGQKVNKILNDTSRAFSQAGKCCAT